MPRKDLKITPISNGTAIDHIPGGMALKVNMPWPSVNTRSSIQIMRLDTLESRLILAAHTALPWGSVTWPTSVQAGSSLSVTGLDMFVAFCRAARPCSGSLATIQIALAGVSLL